MVHIVVRLLKFFAIFIGVGVFCTLGLNVLEYGHETGFESDKNMVIASVDQMTGSIEKSDQSITETGLDEVDDAQRTISLTVNDLMERFEDIIGGFVSTIIVATMSGIWFIKEQGFMAVGEIAAMIERGFV